jgi:hypothetical protein
MPFSTLWMNAAPVLPEFNCISSLRMAVSIDSKVRRLALLQCHIPCFRVNADILLQPATLSKLRKMPINQELAPADCTGSSHASARHREPACPRARLRSRMCWSSRLVIGLPCFATARHGSGLTPPRRVNPPPLTCHSIRDNLPQGRAPWVAGNYTLAMAIGMRGFWIACI